MNTLETELMSTCEALIAQKKFEQAFALLDKTVGFLPTWLKGKVFLEMAEAMTHNFTFKHYPTEYMKVQYRSVLQEANKHLFSTVLNIMEAKAELRNYLNDIIWWQLGHVENELARTTYWVPQPQEEDEPFFEDDTSWVDPNNLIDYINDMKV